MQSHNLLADFRLPSRGDPAARDSRGGAGLVRREARLVENIPSSWAPPGRQRRQERCRRKLADTAGALIDLAPWHRTQTQAAVAAAVLFHKIDALLWSVETLLLPIASAEAGRQARKEAELVGAEAARLRV